MNQKLLKQQQLDELYKPYKNCLQCPLSNLGRTQVVFGEGNPDAKLVIIGEAPGRDEDLKGKPFVGRSGKLLDKVLEALDMPRSEVYITNIVKCRPPNNRTPYPIESETCKKLLLLNQLKIIQPHVICTLGKSAVEGLLEEPVAISRIRGKIISFQNIKLIPTFHPAYILRNQKQLEPFMHDIALAKKEAFEIL